MQKTNPADKILNQKNCLFWKSTICFSNFFICNINKIFSSKCQTTRTLNVPRIQQYTTNNFDFLRNALRKQCI